MITSLGIKSKESSYICKKTRYAIRNVSMKHPSKIIRKFEKLPYKSIERRRPKDEPTHTYIYLPRQLAEFMTRYDALNLDNYPVITEMTGSKYILISQVCSTDDRESKEFLVDENLMQVCSTDEFKSKSMIVYESSTEESKSECVHKSVNK